jgi:hypothetical protein
MGIVEECQVFGGGSDSAGNLYTPEGSIPNYGMGSHGTADGTVYKNNIIGNVSYGINLRGRNEQILDNKFVGFISQHCIDLSYGMNVVIQGNYYNNQFVEGNTASGSNLTYIEDNSFASANIFNTQAKQFIRIQGGDTAWLWGFTHIKENVCRNLNRYFIYIDSSATSDVKTLIVSNNFARITPNSYSLECALIGRNTGTLSLVNCTIDSNLIEGFDSTTTLRTFGAGINPNESTAAGVNAVFGVKTYTCFVAQNAVQKIRTPYNGGRLLISLVTQNAVAARFFGQIFQDNATLVSMGAITGVEGIATPPTGTSGNNGVVTICYDGDFIYIQNRIASSMDAFLTIFPCE